MRTVELNAKSSVLALATHAWSYGLLMSPNEDQVTLFMTATAWVVRWCVRYRSLGEVDSMCFSAGICYFRDDLNSLDSGMTVITWVTSMTTITGSTGVAGLSRIN